MLFGERLAATVGPDTVFDPDMDRMRVRAAPKALVAAAASSEAIRTRT